MKGFTKDGKFRPTEKTSGLSSKNVSLYPEYDKSEPKLVHISPKVLKEMKKHGFKEKKSFSHKRDEVRPPIEVLRMLNHHTTESRTDEVSKGAIIALTWAYNDGKGRTRKEIDNEKAKIGETGGIIITKTTKYGNKTPQPQLNQRERNHGRDLALDFVLNRTIGGVNVRS